MRKISVILNVTIMLLLASACTDEIIPDSVGPVENKVRLTFTPEMLGIDSPAETKAMADNPTIHNIYFAVFDGTGYKLSEYAEAVPNTYANVNGVKFQYSVDLTITKEPRILHVIANAPKRLVYGSESEVIGSLTTSIDAADPDASEGQWKEAYWTRISLPDGVWAAPDVDKHGDPSSDTYKNQQKMYKAVVDSLNNARFVRNFARIIVDESLDNFELSGVWITNYPDRGSVAPYNRITRQFQNYYWKYKIEEDMLDAKKGNYRGYTPASASIISILDGEGHIKDGVSPIIPTSTTKDGVTTTRATTYCYEREYPRSSPLYVIIEGIYNGDEAPSYYKLDLRDVHGDYFPILRNFSYSVHINNVTCSGSPSLEAALSAAPSNGDVSTSLEMQELTNISNGRAQLAVSETSQVIVGGKESIYLRYKFVPDMSDPTTTANTPNPEPIGGLDAYVTIDEGAGSPSDVFESWSVSAGNEADGYRVITLTPYESDEIIKTQTFTLTGHYKKKDSEGNYMLDSNSQPIWESITRTVQYRLRNRLSMSLECVPNVIRQQANQSVVVRIGLEEGLPSSIFSLNMSIEAEHLTLTTDKNDALPVTTGPSIIDGSNAAAYHFVKTITWEDYQKKKAVDGMKYFDCSFLTNRAFSGGAGDRIHVSNEYFNNASASFTSFDEKRFSSAGFAAGTIREEESIAFDFVMPSSPVDGKVRIGLENFTPTSPVPAGGLVMTFVGKNSDGLSEYEVSVTGTSGRVYLTPYESGNGIVKLYASEYESKEVNVTILESYRDITIYADVDGDDASAQDWYYLPTPAVTKDRTAVVGQPIMLTIYARNYKDATDVKIGVDKASASSAYSSHDGLSVREIKRGGELYYAYAITYIPTEEGTKAMNVYIGDQTEPAATYYVTVRGIQRGNRITAVSSLDSGRYYVVQNSATSTYMHLNAANTPANLTSSYDYFNLIQFGGNSSPTSIKFASGVYIGRNNNALALSQTPANWIFAQTGNYTATRTFTLSYKGGWNNNINYYLNARDATTPSIVTSDTNTNWIIYSVSIKE